MSRQAANGVDRSCDTDGFAPQADVFCPVDQAASQRSPCLEAGNDDMTFTPPDIVLQVLFDPAPAALATAGPTNVASMAPAPGYLPL